MGEVAEMMLDGTLCEGCGEFMGDDCGYPRRCAGCGGGGDVAHVPRGSGKRRRAKAKRIRRSQRRRYMLETADVTGWQKLSDYHFRKIVGGTRVDWWPSTGKYSVNGKPSDVDSAEKILKGVK